MSLRLQAIPESLLIEEGRVGRFEAVLILGEQLHHRYFEVLLEECLRWQVIKEEDDEIGHAIVVVEAKEENKRNEEWDFKLNDG